MHSLIINMPKMSSPSLPEHLFHKIWLRVQFLNQRTRFLKIIPEFVFNSTLHHFFLHFSGERNDADGQIDSHFSCSTFIFHLIWNVMYKRNPKLCAKEHVQIRTSTKQQQEQQLMRRKSIYQLLFHQLCMFEKKEKIWCQKKSQLTGLFHTTLMKYM